MDTVQRENSSSTLRIAVDIGGTFTDGIAVMGDQGRIWVGKTLTTPDDPGMAVSTVIADLLREVSETTGDDAPGLAEVVHGTTLVTNTLIERKGVSTALVATSGMRDALDIGREWRYDLYDLDLQLPEPLINEEFRIEVAERIAANGTVLTAPTEEELTRIAQAVKRMGVSSVAVSFLHAYLKDTHERTVADYLAKALPNVAVSISSELASEIKEFERTSTVAASAYVKPLVAQYLRQLQSRIDKVQDDVPLRIMVSSGGFTAAEAAAQTPIFLLESGPAAGVLSAINTAAGHGIGNVLAFDMGGTTAKACVVTDYKAPVAYSFECARVHRFKRGSGLPILIPSVDLIEIGAGGGSIAHVNRMGLLNVGPESAGSVPGPVCYGLGGADITITDADLMLGYLDSANFLGGKMSLRLDLMEQAMHALAGKLNMGATDVAWGIHDMVNENMASAARIHIAEKGHDPREFTMVATGGAGPVHAVEVARKLRIPRVLATIAAGAGSCLGMLAAPARADRSWSQPTLLSEVDWADVTGRLAALREDAMSELAEAGAQSEDIEWLIGAEMRYYGQGDNIPITIPYGDLQEDGHERILHAFEEQYIALSGHLVPGALPQVLTWRLTGRSHTTARSFEWGASRSSATAHRGQRDIYLPLKNGFGAVDIYERYALPAGTQLHGPLILEERESTIVVPVAADVEILADLTVSITLKEFE